MNDVKLSGRLTRDPELKHTPAGVPVATFSPGRGPEVQP